MKKALRFISNTFGFDKLTKYENNYLHDANIRSSSYMGFVCGMVFFLDVFVYF